MPTHARPWRLLFMMHCEFHARFHSVPSLSVETWALWWSCVDSWPGSLFKMPFRHQEWFLQIIDNIKKESTFTNILNKIILLYKRGQCTPCNFTYKYTYFNQKLTGKKVHAGSGSIKNVIYINKGPCGLS